MLFTLNRVLKLSLFANRVFSTMAVDSFLLFFFWSMSHIIADTALFADFCTFFYTTCGLSVVLFLGQDRLLFMVLPDCKTDQVVAKQFLHFVFLLIVLYTIMFLVSLLCLLHIQQFNTHPILLSVMLFPYVNIFEFGANLLRAFEKPFLSRCFLILNLSTFLLLSLFVFDPSLGPSLRHYVILLSVCGMCFGLVVAYWVMRCFASCFDYGVSVFQLCIRPDEWQIRNECKAYIEWIKAGVALFLDTVMTVVKYFAVPASLLLRVPASSIAAYVVIDTLVTYQYSLYVVMKNHLFPMLLPLLARCDGQYATLNGHPSYRRLCLFQWMVMGVITLLVIAVGASVLASYGPGYLDYYTLLLLGALIYCPIYGVVFVNVVMMRIEALRLFFKRYQLVRLCAVVAAIFVFTPMFGVTGLLLAFAVPSLLLMMVSAWRIKRNTGLNIYAPWW